MMGEGTEGKRTRKDGGKEDEKEWRGRMGGRGDEESEERRD